MSAQHTPGPWFLPAENAGSSATSVWARGGDVRVADCNSGAISLPGRQCDARLIAAAPELLAGLIEACNAIERHARDCFIVCGKPATEEGFHEDWADNDLEDFERWVRLKALIARSAS